MANKQSKSKPRSNPTLQNGSNDLTARKSPYYRKPWFRCRDVEEIKIAVRFRVRERTEAMGNDVNSNISSSASFSKTISPQMDTFEFSLFGEFDPMGMVDGISK